MSDPNGYGQLQQADLFIGSVLGAASSCWLEYQPSTKIVFLKSDNNASWTQATLGTASTLQNSQCSVNTGASTASGSGNTLTLALPISFKPAFAGARSLFIFAADNGANTGWQTAGSWTVTVPAGLSVAINPNSGAGRSQTFALQVSDSNGAGAVVQADLFIGGQVGDSNACWIEFYPPGNLLFLRDDANASWSQATVGTSATLSNSQCSVNASSASISLSGSLATLKVPVTFTAGFLGGKNLVTLAADSAGLNTNWQSSGTYTVQ